MSRYARMTGSTPAWLTLDDKDRMRRIYQVASIMTDVTKAPYEVDHEIPLRGGTVSGLHVPWNLRVVTAHFNNSRLKVWDPNQEAA